MGKILIIAGIILLIAGLLIQFGQKIPFLGKLPGDFTFERPGFKMYFPLMTSIILSVVLSLIIYLFNRLKN